ncbi:hypothetical protein QCA50_003128 [Cerrena zonata]|uniref:Uncharacterized protein n=1 Tax=Cerrena zonata TaxID=2478898 RepID=A0AAW0GR76_9APHY
MTKLCLPILVALLSFSTVITAQIFGLNGQLFTRGLAIIDSPAPSSTLHAGSTVGIAVDISGDGHLPASAATPGTKDSTRFDSLEIYFVSFPNSINLTVSGPDANLLGQEAGSTVKHVNYNISSCVPAGQYNLSFYEVSHISDQQFFIISNIPVEIQNTNQQGGCNNTNALDGSPQIDDAPSQSPWLLTADGTTSIAASPTATGKSGAVRFETSYVASVLSLLALIYALTSW